MSDNSNKGVIWAVLVTGALVAGTILYVTDNVSFGFVGRMFEPAYVKAVRSSLENPSTGRFRHISSSLPDGIACGEVSSIDRSGMRTPYQSFIATTRSGADASLPAGWEIVVGIDRFECREERNRRMADRLGVSLD